MRPTCPPCIACRVVAEFWRTFLLSGESDRGIGNFITSLAWWHRAEILATWETEAGGFQIQGLLGLQSDFKTSLDNLVRMFCKPKGWGWGWDLTGWKSSFLACQGSRFPPQHHRRNSDFNTFGTVMLRGRGRKGTDCSSTTKILGCEALLQTRGNFKGKELSFIVDFCRGETRFCLELMFL